MGAIGKKIFAVAIGLLLAAGVPYVAATTVYADPASGRVFMDWGARLFGLQVVVYICMDKALSNNLDLGLFIQTVCLAAQGYGVDSFIAGSLISNQDVLRKELEIPENLNIITGIGLGYPNPDNIINTYRSPRRSINEVVRYKS